MNDKHTTSSFIQNIFTICCICIIGTGCSEDVERYGEVANTTIAAIQDPENFCNYVAENITEMSGGKYINCANEKIGSFQTRIDNERNNCNRIFEDYVGPPDKGYQLLKCDEEHGVNDMEFAIAVLNEFKNIGNGASSCSDISFIFDFTRTEYNATRQFYIDLGLPEPYPEWTVIMKELEESYKQSLVCETVTKRFLGIEY